MSVNWFSALARGRSIAFDSPAYENIVQVGNSLPNAMTGDSGSNIMYGRGGDDTLDGAGATTF